MKFLILSLLLTICANASELTGKVVGIHDGDSFTLLEGKLQHKVRLHGVDAPELGQAFGKKAKQALSAKIFGEQVKVTITGTDQWKRTTGTVYLGSEDVCLWMVQQGFAHHFDKYSGSKKLAEAQKEAKAKKLGLWREYNVQTPDEYRAAQKKKQALKKIQKSGSKDEKAVLQYWLNTKSKVRHNQSCRWFKKTKNGKLCEEGDGKACSKCGG